jgi:hypothetical protein
MAWLVIVAPATPSISVRVAAWFISAFQALRKER